MPVIASVGADREGTPTTSTPTRRPARSPRRCAPTRRFHHRRRGLAREARRAGDADLARRASTRSAALAGDRRRHAPEARRPASRRSPAESSPRTSSTAASRTACCSSSSPTRASEHGHAVSLEELQALEARWAMPTYRRAAGRVRPRRGGEALGFRGQGVPRLPRRHLGLLGRPLPSGGGGGRARAGRRPDPCLQPLLLRARTAAR